jgi:hypothetical protein
VGRRAGSSAARTSAARRAVPGIRQTEAMLAVGAAPSRYAVGRNLVVRFLGDELDGSSRLARLLQARFTDQAAGLGGRLDFRTLAGDHISVTTPPLAAYLDSVDATLDAALDDIDARSDAGAARAWAKQLGVERAAREAARDLREQALRGVAEQRAASALVAEWCVAEARRAAQREAG